MTQTVLPQLQEVMTSLEAEEAAISTQLAEIQAKREALRAVVSLFEESAASSSPTTTTKAKVSTKAKPAAKKSKPAAKAKPAPAAKAPRKTNATSKKKKDGRAATWQKYTLPGVGDQSMPDAVKLILATKPDEDFKIATVMSGLFKENMPKAQYLKARNRISNILSGGVRDGIWYKGDRGAYRLSKPA